MGGCEGGLKDQLDDGNQRIFMGRNILEHLGGGQNTAGGKKNRG